MRIFEDIVVYVDVEGVCVFIDVKGVCVIIILCVNIVLFCA